MMLYREAHIGHALKHFPILLSFRYYKYKKTTTKQGCLFTGVEAEYDS